MSRPTAKAEARRYSITAKMTADEFEQINQYVARLGADKGTATRELWLRELQSEEMLLERAASRQMLDIFVRTMQASLERGADFTVQDFRRLCMEVLGRRDVVKGNAA